MHMAKTVKTKKSPKTLTLSPPYLKAMALVKREVGVNQSMQVEIGLRHYFGGHTALLKKHGVEL